MPKLEPNSQIQLSLPLLKKVLSVYNLNVTSFKVAKGGIENTTALVKTKQGQFAFRVYRKSKKKTREIEQELEFMAYLTKAGLPVPKVYQNNSGKFITSFQANQTRWKAMLMDCMEGEHPKSYTPAMLKDFAKVQAKMHLLGIKFAKKQPKYWTMDRLKEEEFYKAIDIKKLKKQKVKNFLLKGRSFTVILNPKLPKGFNHLDYDHANTLVKNNRLSAILDFDDLTYSPAAVCLGFTLWDIFYMENKHLSNKFASLYLKEYKKHRPISGLELASLKNILLFRNYQIFALLVMFWGENTKNLNLLIELEGIIQNYKF